MKDKEKFKIKKEIEGDEEGTAKIIMRYNSAKELSTQNIGVEKKQSDAEIEQAEKFDGTQRQRIIDLDKKMLSQQRENEQIAKGYKTEEKYLKGESVI